MTATGGTAPYQTKWFLTTDGWQTFSVLRDWATGTSFAWTPAIANANYTLGVWVRSAGNTTSTPEATVSIPFAIE